jgi:type II secretory pathway component PulK
MKTVIHNSVFGRWPLVVAEPRARAQSGSVLIIVLWIAFGLVALALYFADSMNLELRASDNRVSAQSADQAIEGAARYLNYILATEIANGSNGCLPGADTYVREAVPVGDAHFWIIGRETNNISGTTHMVFGLVDESSRLNLNTVSSNSLSWLPRMTSDLLQGIIDWRDTNGNGPTATYYAIQQPSYVCKNYPFETVDELRLVYGADMDILVGEDANRNGILDPNENDDNQNRQVDPGVLEYFTVYSREPNTNSDGSTRLNISNGVTAAQVRNVLTNIPDITTDRVTAILGNLGLSSGAGAGMGTGGPTTPITPVTPTTPTTPGGGLGGPGAAPSVARFASPLLFYVQSGLTSAEFASVFTNLTTVSTSFIEGRVNINTASYTVLTCLLNGDTAAAQQVVNYRMANPNSLTSIAWLVDALGQSYTSDLQALEAGDYITTQSYQFSADVAALGPHGRGYRRVKFVFDTSSGVPQIVYRQDLTHLGWALGADVRQKWLFAKGT